MLIHLGNQEFVDLHACVAILNVRTIDEATRQRALAATATTSRVRSAVLTARGQWLTTVISPEALARRGQAAPFSGALYRRPPARKCLPSAPPAPPEEKK